MIDSQVSAAGQLMPGEEVANIPSNYSRLIGRELELQIKDLPKLLKFTGLSVEQFMRDDTLLTARQQIQILQNGLQLSSHADFSLRLGRRLIPATHGVMGFLANSSPDLLRALTAFQSFVPTRLSFVHLSLITSPERVECYIDFDIPLNPEVHRALSECCMIVLSECAEFIIDRPLTEAHICFTHDQPDYLERYGQFLAGTCEFSAPRLRVTIPMEVCRIPNASANLENYLLAMQQCEAMLAGVTSHRSSCSYQIQKMMLSHPLGQLSEEEAAAALFINKRTLARRLLKEGSSYSQIRDTVLSQQASSYLRHSNMSVDAIASLLNYHDSANFRRAFKRWFNVSPRQYRLQVASEAATVGQPALHSRPA
ncbi:AraC family transcriptional regulator [Fluviicoccus keumensis]|nr:AraC family transcriptional regulator [Fluviicoccus keumensis]